MVEHYVKEQAESLKLSVINKMLKLAQYLTLLKDYIKEACKI